MDPRHPSPCDHFSVAHYLREKTGASIAIGANVVEVQRLWKGFYNWPDFPADGRQWDRLFADGETFMVGTIPARVMFSPGHTPASITYVIGDAAFVHDKLFQPDSGTARADFPGGNARALWHSIQAILALPDETRIFTGHDYQPGGREPQWESTVARQKAENIHMSKYLTEATFVAARQARDATLSLRPAALDPAPDTIRTAPVPATAWHLALAGCGGRQAEAVEVQALPHRVLPYRHRRGSPA